MCLALAGATHVMSDLILTMILWSLCNDSYFTDEETAVQTDLFIF